MNKNIINTYDEFYSFASMIENVGYRWHIQIDDAFMPSRGMYLVRNNK
jgi:hypothetical protein